VTSTRVRSPRVFPEACLGIVYSERGSECEQAANKAISMLSKIVLALVIKIVELRLTGYKYPLLLKILADITGNSMIIMSFSS